MDVQEWPVTWDDEDIVDDFSEILRKEKELLRSVPSKLIRKACPDAQFP